MKRFKFSFLALVALIATSFTVASHQGVFKAKVKVTDGCYQNISTAGFNLNLGNVDNHPGGNEPPCTNQASVTYSGGLKYYPVGGGSSPAIPTVTSASNPIDPTTCTATHNPCCYEVENNQVVRICYKQ